MDTAVVEGMVGMTDIIPWEAGATKAEESVGRSATAIAVSENFMIVFWGRECLKTGVFFERAQIRNYENNL